MFRYKATLVKTVLNQLNDILGHQRVGDQNKSYFTRLGTLFMTQLFIMWWTNDDNNVSTFCQIISSGSNKTRAVWTEIIRISEDCNKSPVCLTSHVYHHSLIKSCFILQTHLVGFYCCTRMKQAFSNWHKDVIQIVTILFFSCVWFFFGRLHNVWNIKYISYITQASW